MKIRLTDLKNRPCDKYYYYIKENYGENEFDPMEVFDVLKPDANDVMWLIFNAEICQTEEWFKYYKSLKPSAYDVSWLKDNREKFREYEDKNENN